MYGHIATATGWIFSQIDQLTLWDVNDLFEYWRDYPPTHVLVAAYLTGGKRTSSSKNRLKSNIDDLAQAISFAGGGIHNKLPHGYKTH